MKWKKVRAGNSSLVVSTLKEKKILYQSGPLCVHLRSLRLQETNVALLPSFILVFLQSNFIQLILGS